jgi:processive 1,2-diacylglycerol beta-glucosyltransferase
MKKNILIISSEFTGHGHKSITDSLKEQFARYSDVNVYVVDGFSLGKEAC